MYKILAIVGVLILSHGLTVYFSHSSGYNSCKADHADALAEATKDDNIKSNEVVKWKIKERVKYVDRIQKIKVAADPTGCLDMDLRDVGLGGMLKNSSH